MVLPRQLAILQKTRQCPWLAGAGVLIDRYELVEIGDREISPPLATVTWHRGSGFRDGLRRFTRRSYALELEAGLIYQLINTSTLVCFRWELRDPRGALVGTASSSLFGAGYRIVLEAASGDLSRTRFKAWAFSVEIRDRSRQPLAKIDWTRVDAGDGRGLLRYRIELDGIALHDLDLQLLITAGVLVKSKLEHRP